MSKHDSLSAMTLASTTGAPCWKGYGHPILVLAKFICISDCLPMATSAVHYDVAARSHTDSQILAESCVRSTYNVSLCAAQRPVHTEPKEIEKCKRLQRLA